MQPRRPRLAQRSSRRVCAAQADVRRTEPITSARSNSVSPFAADSARKGTPRQRRLGDIRGVRGRGRPRHNANANLVIMGSAAPAVEEFSLEADPQPVERTELKPDVKTEARPEANADSLRDAVLNALANQQMLVSILESAEWSLNGNVLTAKVAASSTMIEMSFTADARRIASAAASGQAGRPIKMQVEPGGSTAADARRPSGHPNGSARSRAEQDPIVQRMKEKFKAEIRTVIDYREKG